MNEPENERLKLIALDEADLAVISACLQDAVFKISDITYAQGQFGLEANRFAWERDQGAKTGERRRALLAVKRVLNVRSSGVDKAKKDEVHSLLAIRFVSGDEAPRGLLELVLAGGGIIVLEIECIEIQLADMSGSWGTNFKPRHQAG